MIAGLVAAATAALGLTAAPPARAATTGPGLEISIELAYKTVNAGDKIRFSTVLTNSGSQASPPLNVAMNIVKTGKGDPVDPEDWSPERTQPMEPLAGGASARQDWIVEAILEGDYMVYLTVIPKPDGPDATTTPVSSPGLHLTVRAFSESNPGGVLPVAIGMPIGLVAIALFSRARRGRVAAAVAAE
jgi:hypothetical protein